MTDEERRDAIAHWRELAVDVLTAVRATMSADQPAAESAEGPGRAVVVFEDAGEQDVAIHVAFHPELQEVGEELAGTPAQVTAMALLQELGPDDAE
jgi:hypothetical protein